MTADPTIFRSFLSQDPGLLASRTAEQLAEGLDAADRLATLLWGQIDSLGLNADGIMIIEGPDTTRARSTVRALEWFAAKFGLRAVAQAMARELGPKNIHVAHLIIDSGVDTAWVRERREQIWGKEALNNPDLLMPPASVAASHWQLYQQPRSAWTFELEIRPFGEKW